MDILLASNNKSKVKEINSILKDFNFNIKTLKDFNINNIEETGKTFKENALIKAKFAHEKSGLVTLADDSGLEVKALNNRPGVYSARYGGNVDNNTKMDLLLEELKAIPKELRQARFVTSLVLYVNKNNIFFFDGIWDGEILFEKIGNNGFGYDPIFYDPKLKKSAAQLTLEEKSIHSHRAKALKNFLKELPKIIFKK